MLKAKVWGSTDDLVANPFCEVHKIEVAPGGYCSWHIHNKKANLFLVTAGNLRIELETDAGYESLVLGPGMSTVVPSGVKHRFINDECKGTTRGLEVYWPDGLGEVDIERDGTGGLL